MLECWRTCQKCASKCARAAAVAATLGLPVAAGGVSALHAQRTSAAVLHTDVCRGGVPRHGSALRRFGHPRSARARRAVALPVCCVVHADVLWCVLCFACGTGMPPKSIVSAVRSWHHGLRCSKVLGSFVL